MGFEACVGSVFRRFDLNACFKFIVVQPPNADVEKVEFIRGNFYGR